MELTSFLPHTRSMRFVDTRISFDGTKKSGVFSLTLDASKPYFSSTGAFQSPWLLEMLAQAAAGVFYFMKQQEGQKQQATKGFLVGIEQCRVHPKAHSLAPGDLVRLETTMTFDFFPFGVYSCKAFLEHDILAEGDFKFVTEDKEFSH